MVFRKKHSGLFHIFTLMSSLPNGFLCASYALMKLSRIVMQKIFSIIKFISKLIWLFHPKLIWYVFKEYRHLFSYSESL